MSAIISYILDGCYRTLIGSHRYLVDFYQSDDILSDCGKAGLEEPIFLPDHVCSYRLTNSDQIQHAW